MKKQIKNLKLAKRHENEAVFHRKFADNLENATCSIGQDIIPTVIAQPAQIYMDPVAVTLTKSVFAFIDTLNSAKKYKDLQLVVDNPKQSL